MGHSERDKDLRKMRQLAHAKSALIPKPCPLEDADRIMRSAAYVKLQTDFDRLFAKYGFNAEIFKDNERAGSKRTVTRKIKNAVRRSEKRSEKQIARRGLTGPIEGTGDA
ncbi:MAG: hypothetical protein CFE44_07265 [Burkholderiales bacterium PBB4]|nr:MAG: hypothetical protein CFE44_07265 [Burkholderiales bacterium PBB4]